MSIRVLDTQEFECPTCGTIQKRTADTVNAGDNLMICPICGIKYVVHVHVQLVKTYFLVSAEPSIRPVEQPATTTAKKTKPK